MSEYMVAPTINYRLSNPEITLFVSDNLIDFIGCYEELLYKGTNLIGLHIDQFSVLVDEDYGEEDELYTDEGDEPHYVYEYKNVGLQVWAKGRLGIISSIMVNGVDHYVD